MFLDLNLCRKEPIMKPKLIDRLLTVTLCVILVLAFWCLSLSFAYHDSMLAAVF